uniref:Phospholipase A(2) n=1 Tax=Rhabditophanes sp. KR3021 TaxID=114890 RepID=A0AC35TUP4_9BILA
MIVRATFYITCIILFLLIAMALIAFFTFPSFTTIKDARQVWSCGTEGSNTIFAYQSAKNRCPEGISKYILIKILAGFNDCCVHHDRCYQNQLGRTYCDKAFCNCCRNNLGPNKNNEMCLTISKTFCNLVTTMGVSAYKNSEITPHHNQGRANFFDRKFLDSFLGLFKFVFS